MKGRIYALGLLMACSSAANGQTRAEMIEARVYAICDLNGDLSRPSRYDACLSRMTTLAKSPTGSPLFNSTVIDRIWNPANDICNAQGHERGTRGRASCMRKYGQAAMEDLRGVADRDAARRQHQEVIEALRPQPAPAAPRDVTCTTMFQFTHCRAR